MDIKAKLSELAASCLLREDHFLVDVVLSSKNLSKITVVVDGDKGITIDDCSEISRELSRKLDEANIGESSYVLEVTSPGLDHPLKLRRQFQKNTGRDLKVHTKEKVILQGTLQSVSEGELILTQKVKEGKSMTSKEVAVPFDKIDKAFVMISFKS